MVTRAVFTEIPLVYPWADLPEDSVICDIAGNNGHVMLDLIKAFPRLKVVVQDLEGVRPRWAEVCLV